MHIKKITLTLIDFYIKLYIELLLIHLRVKTRIEIINVY